MNKPPMDSRIELLAWISLGALLFVLLRQVEAFEWFFAFSRSHEDYDLDEVALLLIVFGALLPVMLVRKNSAMRKRFEAHQKREEELHSLATVDSLTRLGSLVQFQKDLLDFAEHDVADGRKLCLIKINLDRFKQINDLRGMTAGDVLLTRISDRIRSICQAEDSVSRTNGDEFAILTRVAGDEGRLLADQLLHRLKDPIDLESWRAELTSSIGFAVWEDGLSADELLSRADQALAWAKQSGRSCVVAYEAAIGDLTRRAAQLRADLIHAVNTDVIKPYFQPIVCLKSGELVGFEALARWQHAERGFVSPEVFIALAEDLGLIDKLTDNLFARCCGEMANWPENLRLSFNLSPVQLSEQAQETAGDLTQRLLTRLEAAGIEPGRIDPEITERAVISDLDSAREVIGRLRDLGIRISLDDFGTGTSSLSVLVQLPFDTIKIDRSFVTDIAQRPDLAKVVRSVLFLANTMGIAVTAEGIETPEELWFLREHYCDKGQGYLLGRPARGDQLGPIMERDGAVWDMRQVEQMRVVS